MAERSLTLATIFTGDVSHVIAAIDKFKTATQGMNAVLGGAGDASKKAAGGLSSLGGAADKGSKATNKASVAMDSMAKGAGVLYSAYDRFTRALKVVAAYGIASTAIFAVVNAMKVGVTEIIDYDQALKNLQAITGATNAEIAIMDETMRSVARSTKFSTGEVAEGMVLLGQAGFSATESLDAINAVATLATATLSDFATTADLVTTAIRAYNLNTKESTRVADVMANAINKSKLTIDKLRTAFNYVAASASQAGISLEETAATMMVLADNGMRASTIGTGMRQVLARLVSPNEKLRESYEAMNISLDKISPLTAGYTEAIKNLSAVLWDHEKRTVNMAKAFQLFQLRGAQAAAVIVKSYMSGDFQKALDYTYEVGTAAEMSATQQEGLGIAFKNLADRAKLVAIALGDAGVAGALRLIVYTASGLVTAIERLVGTTFGSLILQAGVVTAVILGIAKAIELVSATILFRTIAMAKYLSLWEGLGVVLIDLKRILLSIISPTIAIVLAATAAAIGFYKLATAGRDASEAADEAAVKIKAVAETLSTFLEVLRDAEKGSKLYESVIKRMTKEQPKLAIEIMLLAEDMLGLKNVVDLNSLSFEQLEKVLVALNIKRTTEAFSKQAEAIEYHARVARNMADEIRGTADAEMAVGEALADVGDIRREANKKIEISRGLIKELVVGLRDEVAAKRLSKEAAFELIDSWKTLEAIIPGFAAKMKDDLVEGLRLLAEQTANAKSEMQAFIAELPIEFQKYYEKLDVLRQADFNKVQKSINQEVAAYKKQAVDLGHNADQQNEAIAAIKMRGFADYIGNLYKEYEGEKENAARKLAVIEQFTKDAVIKNQDKLNELKIAYEKDVIAAEGNEKKIAELQLQYLKQKEKQDNIYRTNTKAANDVANKYMLDGLKATYEEATKVIKSQLSDLSSNLKTFKEELKAIFDTIKSEEESYSDKLRNLRQKTMTDEQVWLDDRKEANRLLNNAIITGDADAAKKSQDLFFSLAKEVKGVSGNTIRGMSETVKIAEEGFTRAHEVLVSILKKQADETKNKIKETESSISSLNVKLEEYKTKLIGLAESQISINVSGAIAGLEEAIRQIDGVKEKVGTKEDPVIFEISTVDAITSIRQIFIPLNEVQGKLKELSAGLYIIDLRGSGSATTGLIDKLNEVSLKIIEVINKLKEMAKEWIAVLTIRVFGISALKEAKAYYDSLRNKTVTVTIKTVKKGSSDTTSSSDIQPGYEPFAGGGPIPGTGSGDKVHILGEPGEFMIKKDAVAKYGANLFSAYNNMLVGIKSRFRRGGLVVQQPKRMASGGPVSQTIERFGDSRSIYNITVAPTFMMGDRRSAEQAAIIIKQKLIELGARGY
uniref:Putative tail protein n=1 Tax=viral metagenome TaxID=1070528 RepID=A0A6M3IHH5_9ZZZZ